MLRPKPYSQPARAPVVIGWFGSPSTEKFLHLLDDVFMQLARGSARYLDLYQQVLKATDKELA
ncbi:hypothetical protein EYC98_05855 [Halieaceae bacterium IMCC14734]|uniref:Uncharacterized protein n=1 Tax=Candidatus Litorirhabdus singularis TaxID=2518993 RepID=A0ABT3TDK6_9GAMM|nr:hypothetical protein [Candidatus Litorirhabdus singularis]MCX2980395.1 hypothetical protein [Candidatus Litorirhabdus singularis]